MNWTHFSPNGVHIEEIYYTVTIVTLTTTDGTRRAGRTLGGVTLTIISLVLELWSTYNLTVEQYLIL